MFVLCVSFVSHAEHLPKIQWLSGAWQNNQKSGKNIQLLVSRSNTNKTFSFEHFEIREKNGVLELEVFPENQKTLTMKATLVTSKKVVFENSKHDFPKLWSFELKKDGTLVETAKNHAKKIVINFVRKK